jgi:tetratricopeptide (TPR) repeat protein
MMRHGDDWGDYMDFVILGPTALHIDGRPVPLGPAKQRGMLAVLLYHVGEPVRIDTIVEHLWGDRVRVDRRPNLYSLASRIRAALQQADLGNALRRVPSIGAYRLDVDPDTIDFHRFRQLVSHGREAADRQQYPVAVEALNNAIQLWRDEPLADLHAACGEQLRRGMKTALLDARKLLVANQLRLHQHHRALVELEPLMRANELDETLAQLRITALCAAGRDHDAHMFFQEFRRQFRRQVRAEPAVEFPRPAGAARPADTVPPRTATAAPPQQLPKDVNAFTGQEQLLAELDAITRPGGTGANVVAISGMPGVGKTSLAVHWAHRRRERFPEGQLYLDGNAYGPTAPVDPEEALGRFLDALEVPADRMPTGREQRRNRFNQLLAERRMLIVLDNVQDTNQVRPLIPTGAGCLTLITSRTRLRGLTVRDAVPNLTVDPLTGTDCLALLTRTVGDARARAEPGALRALAQLSGGLPLALRIIAEHVAERPRAAITDLVGELTARLLDAGGEDDQEASLGSVFAWSYHALVPDAARLFRLLGLQPGPSIGPAAAAALLGTGTEHAEQLLNALAKAHLINHDVARHYRVHDLLRRFAADRAVEEDPEPVRLDALRRLLDWFLLSGVNAVAVLAPDRPPIPDLPAPAAVTPMRFGGDAEALAWCEAERDNLSAAGLWAARHGFDRPGWQLPEVLLELFQRRGHQEDVLPLLRSALAAAERDGHEIAQVGTLNNIGTAYFALHDYPNAALYIEAALRLTRRIRFAEAETICQHNLAAVHLSNGDARMAARIERDVLAACRRATNPMGLASALHNLGDALSQLGEHDEALEHYLEALGIRERTGSLRGQGATQRALATLYLRIGRPDRAIGHARRALDIHDQTRDEPGLCDALVTMADVERELELNTQALYDARRAAAISIELADARRQCQALTALAGALAAAGDTEPALRRCGEAMALLDELDDPQLRPARERLLAIQSSLAVKAG